jgi:hypothetical protein
MPNTIPLLSERQFKDFADKAFSDYMADLNDDADIALARAIESATRTPLLARIAEIEALREWQRVEINRLYSERDQLRAQVAATVPADSRVVPVEFLRGVSTLAHNYALKAEAPCYYHGVERDAFSAAYARCGRDLAAVMALLTTPPTTHHPGGQAMTTENQLREALRLIAEWESHPAGYGAAYGSNGVRDFYRSIARAALTQPTHAASPQDLTDLADIAEVWANNPKLREFGAAMMPRQPAPASTSGWIETAGSAPVKLDWSEPAPTEQPSQAWEVVAWVRFRSDGEGYEGPLMDSDSRMDDTRRAFWTRLSSAAPPKPVSMTPEDERMGKLFAQAYSTLAEMEAITAKAKHHHHITSKGE